MNITYDYCIVGAGPCGLTLAYLFSSIGKKCIIIDNNKDVGGCHRVNRINGLFSEHGPRIYSNSFKNAICLLKTMNIDFYKLFTPYNFTISNIGNYTLKNFNYNELKSFILHYLYMIIRPEHGKNVPIKKFMDDNLFTNNTKDYIDRLCLLTDGASSNDYSLNKFFQLVNQQFLHTIYQPKSPNDFTLFKIWKQKLIDNNVDILLNTTVTELNGNIDNVKYIKVYNESNHTFNISADKFVMCIPPKPLLKLLLSNNIYSNSFGNIQLLTEWVYKSSYTNYIPISFHWSDNIKLENVWGFPKTEWGIAFIVLSNYMKFNDERSQVVISTCVTRLESISKFINKTANQCDEYQLKEEVFRQLKLSFPKLPEPSYIIMNPNISKINNKWIEPDTAFIQTYNNTFLNSKSDITKNLYQVGTQNGNSKYSFTTMETAVTNSIIFSNELEKDTCKIITKTNSIELNDILRIIFILILILFLRKIIRK
jgi:hypothetical protein